jgi:NitT/TauT family transport system substrate-binding protein
MIDRRRLLIASFASVSSVGWGPAIAQSEPLRVASVKYGSLNWLLETIKAEGLDAKAGLTIDPVELSNNQAGAISLLSGGSDVIVSDWTWALRQRSQGEALKFAPYSSTLGAVMVAANSPIKSLKDLQGLRLGVAGSGIDKSWLLLQAYAKKKLDFDLPNKATIQFGAAPLLTEQMRDGQLDAVLNFWTQTVRLKSLGFVPLLTMADVIRDLDIKPIPAFVGFVWKEASEATKGPQIRAFLSAVQAGNAVLATSDAAWERVKPFAKAANDSELAALRQSYISGIVNEWTAGDMASAEKIMQLLVEAGDTELVGAKTRFDPKLFHVSGT